MNRIKLLSMGLLAGITLISVAQKEYFKTPYTDNKLEISCKVEKLVSRTGEDEKYANTELANDKISIAMKKNKLPFGAVEYAFIIKSSNSKRLLLRPLITVDVPAGNLTWWNGYNNMRKLSFDPCDINLSNWFPANAAFNNKYAMVVGINPVYLYSRVDSGKIRTKQGDKLFLGLPLVLEPGKTFKYSFVVSSCRARYGYRDIVQHWYDIFPKAFSPAEGIDPDVISGESSYMYWKPQTVSEKFVGDFIRRLFGGRGSWEWCYKPLCAWRRLGDFR